LVKKYEVVFRKIYFSQADEDIEPLAEIQQFVKMVSKPDLLSHLLQTPII